MEIGSRYNSREVEPKILKKWLEGNYFHAQVNPKRKPFSILIPPPNITGILHMGHALNNTIQDVLVRFKRMCGFETLWMPGTDHAGIATQNVVEKKLAKEGLRKEDIGREEFIKRLWAWKDEYGSTIIEQLKKLGASCDWERIRFTMDEEYSQAVTRVFVELWRKNLIYQDDYIINWCPRCKTALSDEEAPRQEKEGFLYYINYPIKDSDEFVTVATTRPETMFGDVAVAVNPEDKRYKSLWNKTIILPLIEREIKVIKDKFVDPKFGTGVVKVTPAHDLNDFEMASRHKQLQPILVMNPDGSMNEKAADFKGMDRFEAREAIIQILKERKLLKKIEPHSYAVGHCYRCNTMIEPYLSRQWFVKMKPLAKPAIKAVKKGEIKFYPRRWTKVYLNWMENIRDWCISRQIWWGHRLPVYYCQKCKEGGEKNNDSRFGINDSQFRGVIVAKEKPKRCPDCGSADIIQDENVLDTWFSSWLWPFATFGWPFEKRKTNNEKRKIKEFKYFYPTNVLVTAPEIIFFWVARMIMAGLEFIGKKPFSNVFIHGTVRDTRGKKMSKSLGNIIDPVEIIDKFGADALRFSLTMLAASGSDVYLSDEKFLVGRNFSNKIWNATRFIFLKLKENNIKVNSLKIEPVDEIDKWVLKELDETREGISSDLDQYFLNEAAKKIYDFFWHTFCDWYIEIVKDDFTLERAKISLYVLLNSMKLLHPFMPFISEEIFQLIKDNTSLSLEEALICSKWPEKLRVKIDKKEIERIEGIIEAIQNTRNLKILSGLGTKKVILEVKSTADNLPFLIANKGWIQRLTSSADVEFKNSNKGERLKRVLYANSLLELNLSGDIDERQIALSLDKKIQAKEVICDRVKQRLGNEQFKAKASRQKFKEEEDRWKSLLLEINQLKELKNAFK